MTRKVEADGLAERIHFAWHQLAAKNEREATRAVMQQFDLGWQSAKRYVKAVRKMWEIEGSKEPEKMFAETRARFADMYEECRASGDMQSAIKAADRLAVLDGFGNTIEHRVLVKETRPRPIIISDERALEILDELREQKRLTDGRDADIIDAQGEEIRAGNQRGAA